MPFGRHRGRLIADLPNDYLNWLLTRELDDWLHDAVRTEHQRRTDRYDNRREYQAPPPPPPTAEPGLRIKPDEVSLTRRLVDTGYHAMARALHPDLGGDVEQMRRLNLLAASLRSQLEALGAK
jgi:hypothetical protein